MDQMDQTWQQKFSRMLGKRGNIFFTVILTIIGLLVLNFILAASGNPLFTSAANFANFAARVSLVGPEGKRYPQPPDFIEVDPGQVIEVGWKAFRVTSCQANGWTDQTALTVPAMKVGPFTDPVTILSVSCGPNRNLKPVSASLEIHLIGAPASQVTSPKKGDVWMVGKTYTINWKNATQPCSPPYPCDPFDPLPPTCQPWDLGCDANLDYSGNNPFLCAYENTACDPIPVPPTPIGSPTITLNHPPLPCLTGPEPRCLPVERTPYTIRCDVKSATSCTWTIPTSFDPYFLGAVMVTVAPNDGRSSFSSDVFTIVRSEQPTSGVIRVTSPNGGESWQRGSSKEITWQTGNLPGLVNIDIVNDVPPCSAGVFCIQLPSVLYPLGNQTPNDGSFIWSSVGVAKGGASIPNGNYLIIISDRAGHSDDSDAPFSITSASVSENSGIEGTITIGPACPGPIGGNACPDKPYQTDMVVKTSNGSQVVKKFSSDANGKFRVSLDPGSYIIASATPGGLPAFGEQFVTVKPNGYTHLELTFDSGMR